MIETNNYKVFYMEHIHSRTTEAELFGIFGANKGMLAMYVLNENKSRATQ